jgi:small-conductance mechanosensitive channel
VFLPGVLAVVLTVIVRRTVKSIIVGLSLKLSNPYTEGDWIQIEGVHGIVTEFSLIRTTLQTDDGEYVSIPNSKLSNELIRNKTDKGRISEKLALEINGSVDIDVIETELQERMSTIPSAIQIPKPRIHIASHEDGTLMANLVYWIEPCSRNDRMNVKHEIICHLKEIDEITNIE